MRSYGQRQFLPELRRKKASATACGRCLEMQMRRHGYRKILSRVRKPQAGARRQRLEVRLRRVGHGKILSRMRLSQALGARLDLLLRRCESGKILRGMRCEKASGRTPLPLRQVRLEAGRPEASAEILPRVRRSLRRSGRHLTRAA